MDIASGFEGLHFAFNDPIFHDTTVNLLSIFAGAENEKIKLK